MKDQGLLLISAMLGKHRLTRFDYLHNERWFEHRKSERHPWEPAEQCRWRPQVGWGAGWWRGGGGGGGPARLQLGQQRRGERKRRKKTKPQRLRAADAELYHCRLPAVDSNWTEQVPSIIVAAEEDRRGEAQLWGCATVGTTWLTTHLQIHDRALSVCERSAWCHASASVTYSDRVTVSEPVGWLSFWVTLPQMGSKTLQNILLEMKYY